MASTAVIEAIRRTQDDCPSEPADKHLLETNNPTELRGVPGSLGNPGIQGQARGTVAPDPPPEPGFFGANATARLPVLLPPRRRQRRGRALGAVARLRVQVADGPASQAVRRPCHGDPYSGARASHGQPNTLRDPFAKQGGAPRFLRHFLLDDARLGDDDKAESGAAAVGLWAGRRRDSKTIRLT